MEENVPPHHLRYLPLKAITANNPSVVIFFIDLRACPTTATMASTSTSPCSSPMTESWAPLRWSLDLWLLHLRREEDLSQLSLSLPLV
ncbi:hypothetical protein RchiOBHm_Chr2g0159881 [Rosa chinensis]|uniref:Uncharacterized protein n=1 Tax=Rosa chinensis TaxID=74649 RepID=A0A2P6S2F6_ROSCH|nr:hypothetical protein RchiOBHm_Chr2g0159881 [Rosa chinensis]